MNRQTFSPTVLLVDDDPAVLDLALRRFYAQTSLGVVVVDNLSAASELVKHSAIRFNAVVADLSIMPNKQDEQNKLHDGLDFLKFIKRRKGGPFYNYILSVYADVETFRSRARREKLDIRAWFQKLDFGSSDADNKAPWHVIERDLYMQCFGNDPDLAALVQSFGEDEEAFSDAVRKKLRPITRTYLQALPEPFRVKVPIEVICRHEEDSWTADALNLGLLQSGYGETIGDALEELGELIADQFNTFNEATPTKLEGYAGEVFDRFRKHISINMH